MSRIIVFEIPDECRTAGRDFLKLLREVDKRIDLRVMMSFESWVELNEYDKRDSSQYLPVWPHYKMKTCDECKGVGKLQSVEGLQDEFYECLACYGVGEIPNETNEHMIERYEKLSKYIAEYNITPLEKREEMFKKYGLEPDEVV